MKSEKPVRSNPMRARLIAVVMGVACCIGRLVRADDWETYQHDTAHTGFSNSSPYAPGLVLKWSAPTGYATPQIVGNDVIATKNGQGTGTPTTISSFQLDTGALNWSYTASYVFPSEAAYGNGLVAITGGNTTGPLNVLDANTGAMKYSVPSTVGAQFPLMVPQVNGTTTAYLANGNNVQAVSLGATSGTVLWTASGSYGGQSIPTLVGGNTLIVAGPGQYYAINTANGAENHFQAGNISGGGGDTVVYDASRSQFYVTDDFNSTTTAITAYHYGGAYNAITQVWQVTGTGVGNGGAVALDGSGNVYSVDNGNLIEVNPSTGAVLRTRTGQSFANGIAPLIAGNTLWAYSNSSTIAYDLTTLNVIATLPGSRGSLNTAFDSPGAVDSNHYLIDYGDIFNSPGFKVYSVPEPSGLLVAAITMFGLGSRLRKLTAE